MLHSRITARKPYIEFNSWVLVALSSGQGLLALACGDAFAAQWWLAISVAGAAGTLLFRDADAHLQGVLGLLYFMFLSWAAHVILPSGVAPLVVVLSFAFTLVAVAGSYSLTACTIVVTVAVPLVLHAAGAFDTSARMVPTWAAGMWSFLVLSWSCATQFRTSRRRLTRSITTMKVLRQRMLDEQETFAAQRSELFRASEYNRLEIDRLTMQLVHEAELMDDLRLRQEDKRSVVHAIHHDLKEPLRNIVSFTQLARRKLNKYEGSETLADYLAFAEDGGRRMSVMLEDLMSYASDPDPEPPQTLDLDAVLAEVVKNLGGAIDERGALVEVGPLFSVTGQRTQIVQLFQNLLSNALKFVRAGVRPSIRVSAEPLDDGTVEIRVADNGIGIPANQIDKVFGLFNRAHAEQAFEGSGVGLALCRKIVLAHGGQIRVASVPGEGTQFYLVLPPVTSDAEAVQDSRLTLSTADVT